MSVAKDSSPSATQSNPLHLATLQQQGRNDQILDTATAASNFILSNVINFQIDLRRTTTLSPLHVDTLGALRVDAARTAIRSLARLSKINEMDHLGGGLELIDPLTLTLAVAEHDKRGIHFTIEHGHTSVGYYSSLAAFEYLDKQDVLDRFRQSVDISGHVVWRAGGSAVCTGRLGVGFPVGVGEALGVRAEYGKNAWQIIHCGDAGWASGQAKDGMVLAAKHKAPVLFVMNRNGIQLSGRCADVTEADPRVTARAEGVNVIEIKSLHNTLELYQAYRQAWSLRHKQPTLIYPTGEGLDGIRTRVTIGQFAKRLGIYDEAKAFAEKNGVQMSKRIWVPGSLMSMRDLTPMLECLFYVNSLPGGAAHHDGHMKGRDETSVLANPMLQLNEMEGAAINKLRTKPRRERGTTARPAPGSENLKIPAEEISAAKLPEPRKLVSARAGSELAYTIIARSNPTRMHIVGCDLNPSTKLEAAAKLLPREHVLECAVRELGATLLANGISMGQQHPHFVAVSTFAAFFEGIAREGLAMSTYTQNLNGRNEGVNVMYHLSHTGSQTGRDHYPGWSLDWMNVVRNYLPHLDRGYTPADARSAFIAVIDAAERFGGHIICIPRDNLPILVKEDGTPLYQATDKWEPITSYRTTRGAQTAFLSVGAPSYLAGEAVAALYDQGIATDAHIINGLPIGFERLEQLVERYPRGVVTIEDGNIGTSETGLKGLAAIVANAAYRARIPHEAIGITDPTVAPSEGPEALWKHFGITTSHLTSTVQHLAGAEPTGGAPYS